MPSILLSACSVALEEAGLSSVAAGSGGFEIGHFDRKSAAQVYELHRGHTTAVIEGFDWARDGRWMAFGMRIEQCMCLRLIRMLDRWM